MPLAVRSRVLEHARNELNGLAERATLKELEPFPDNFWTQFSALESALDKRETSVLEGLFAERQKAIEDWIAGPCERSWSRHKVPSRRTCPT